MKRMISPRRGLGAAGHRRRPDRRRGPGPKGQSCRMEQQCHWVNFKKICTYVKVCR